VKFIETPLAGVFLIEAEPIADVRGHFARTYCEREFAEHGLNTHWPQMNSSFNAKRGTLRGLHFQAEPHAEDKLIRCMRGAIFDVAVDLRVGSKSYGRCFGVELNQEKPHSLYIPKGCAHGFQTLSDVSELSYLMSTEYVPGSARGIRWDDPSLGIAWPLPEPIVSDRDQAFPLLKEVTP
jgi:dTDP-4-dehydrorhamnose 3,5-epimerase